MHLERVTQYAVLSEVFPTHAVMLSSNFKAHTHSILKIKNVSQVSTFFLFVKKKRILPQQFSKKRKIKIKTVVVVLTDLFGQMKSHKHVPLLSKEGKVKKWR